MMNWNQYLDKFKAILNGENSSSPYDKPSYVNYTKLNNSRVKRWTKTGKLTKDAISTLRNLPAKQKWILITEPWCGDTANTVPIINIMANASENIDFSIHLRDSEPFLIDSYLTNGGKSVPMLIIRDENDKDLFTWGPRPKECQLLVQEYKESCISNQEKEIILQDWYRNDKGISTQEEIIELIKKYA